MSTPIQKTPVPVPPSPTGITMLLAPVPAAAGVPEQPPLPEQPFSAFGSISQFRDAQRMATMLAHSSIVPENYRGEEHLGNCVIALEIANRIGASILGVMQNLQLVQGRPGWSSQFLISCVNASKRFSSIRYEMTGTRGEDSWGCIAWAIDKTGERLNSPEVTIKIAKAEGWYDRPGSKWKTMPELMLCYRSATLLARLYAPEITMGIQTTEEVVDLGAEGNGQTSRPIFKPGPGKAKVALKSHPEPQDTVPMNFPPPQATAGPKIQEGPPPKSAATTTPAEPVAVVTVTKSSTGQYNYLKALSGLIGLSRHSEANVLSFLRDTRRCDESLSSLAEVADKQSSAIVWTHDNWKSVDRELTRLKQDKPL